MAGRSVSVFLHANVAGFVSGMRTAGAAVGSLERRINSSSAAQRQALSNTGRAGTVMAAGLVGGFLLSVRAAMRFEKAMSGVQAATQASAADMQKLSKAALEAGKSTAYSASEVARGQTELAKAGVKVADILGGGLKGALDLAAAGELSVGEAAETAAIAMAQFHLAGKDVPHVADLLAAGANKALGEVHDLGYALKMGGLVANQFGISVEDTVGTLAAFAQAGLIGSDSGTSFKTMLIHLAKPTDKAQALMDSLGIAAYDASGHFIGLTALAGVLQSRLSGLTEEQRNAALATIFGTDAIRGANVLYTEGARGIQSWIDQTNDAGFAAKVAAQKMNNLAGDLKHLKGAIDVALIQGGSAATGGLRGMTKAVTGTINAYSALPGSIQGGLFAIAGVTGAALLGGAALVFMAKTVREARVALTALGVTGTTTAAAMARVRAAMVALFASNAALNRSVLGLRAALGVTGSFLLGPWGVALAAGIGLLAVFQMNSKNAAKASEEFVAAIKADSGAYAENTRAAVVNELSKKNLLETAKSLGLQLSVVTDAILGNKTAYTEVKAAIDAENTALVNNTDHSKAGIEAYSKRLFAVAALSDAIEHQSGSLKKSAEKLGLESEAMKQTSTATKGTTGALQLATGAIVDHTSAEQKLIDVMWDASKTADDLKNSMDELANAYLTAERAAIAQRDAARAASKESDHRRGLSDKEKTALFNLSELDQKRIISMKANGETGETLAKMQQHLTGQFIKQAIAMGASRSEATALARKLGLFTTVAETTSSSLQEFIGRAGGAASAAQKLASRTGAGSNSVDAYKASIQKSLPVLYAMAGKSKDARKKVDDLASSAGVVSGKMNTSKKAFMKAADAMGISELAARDLWKQLQKIKDVKANVDVDAQGHWKMSASRIAQEYVGSAKGGPIPSLGPDSSRHYDSVPAMLRVDEHVWTPEEVDSVGGHGAMYRLRAAAKRGELQGFDKGGQVAALKSGSGAVNTVLAPIREGISDLVAAIARAAAAAWKEFASGGSIVAAARSQIGMPYSWGGGGSGGPSYGIERGAGTYGFDCSGLTEYAWWQGRHKSIGGTTGPQAAGSTSISGPRPGALGFVGNPIHHVMLGSNKPGMVIQAPNTGGFVEEVSRSSSNWRWPSGMATGGEVRLGELVSSGRGSPSDVMMAKILQLAGSGPRGAERHTAQIAPAGDIRMWGEKETGGEAYIPLAPSKRARSKAILAAVARTFGMSVRGMADGGIISYADGGVDDVNLSDIMSAWTTAVDPAAWSDVTAAKATKKTQADQVAAAKKALAKAKQTQNDRIRDAEKRLARAKASKGAGRANRIEDAQEALKRAKRADTVRAAEAKLKKERVDLTNATKKLTEVEKRYQYSKQSPATQLGSALALNIKNKGAFIANLTKLADRGFGMLAQQLLAMGGTEAEKIAADAVKLSSTKLSGLEKQMKTSATQQETLENLPGILNVRSAVKSLGTGSSSWIAMLNATGLDPGSLSTAVHLMTGDLGKTSAGQALLADMKAHGYAAGGWIRGLGGVDSNLVGATAGEYMIRRGQAAKYGPLLEAINSDKVGNAMLRRYISGGSGGTRAMRGEGSSAPQFTNYFQHKDMDANRLAREVAREAAWMLSS